MLWFECGHIGEPIGESFVQVQSLHEAHALIDQQPGMDRAFVVESDSVASGTEIVLTEFREVWDVERGWRSPNLNARTIDELWD